MRPLFILTTFLFQIALNAQEYNILDFGAIPDGKHLNTVHIQTAIDSAYANGGGTIVIPEGNFLTGTIVLKSNIKFLLKSSAKLTGSTNPDDYQRINYWKALIMAHEAENVSISGEGEIDGQGRALALFIDSLFYIGEIDSARYNFVEKRPKEYLRPVLIQLNNCKNSMISGITLKNSSSWVQVYERCTGLSIDKINVISDAYWNNDGIDIVDCKQVRLTNAHFDSADDGICLKSHHPDFFCEDIYIADCKVRSSASAVKFGTKSLGGFRSVRIERIEIFDTFRSAIAIESVDGGFLEDIVVENIQAKNTGNAIFIKLGKREKDRPAGTLKNIILRNIQVEIAFERPDYAYDIRGPGLPFFHNIFPASITGLPDHPIKNLVLENITITYPGRGNNGLANMPLSRLDKVPEKASDYPEFSMFGELPAWGFYVRHTDGMIMKNMNLKILAPDYRPAFVFDDVHHVVISNLKIRGDSKEKLIILHDCSSFELGKGNEDIVLKL